MTPDTLDWMAGEANLPLVRVTKGVLTVNAAARTRCGRAVTIEDALSRILDVPSDDADLIQVVKGGTQRHAHTVGGHRVLVITDGPTTHFLCIPPSTTLANEVRRRAALSDLAAGVSHELSNTMGGIIGWTELARRQVLLDPDTERAITHIEASARAVHATASHMLQTMRGPKRAETEPVDLSALIAEVCEVIAPIASDARVSVEFDNTHQPVVNANHAQLFTVLWNLIQNAIEASQPGQTVSVSARREDGSVTLEVLDEGPGVPQQDSERIFDAYYTTKESGTGLGLVLCRQAVNMIGGTLRVEPAQPQGARFVVQLPTPESTRGLGTTLDSRTQEPNPKAVHPADEDSGIVELVNPKGARILVVDDDASMRELIATALSLNGANVTTASSGTEALSVEGPFELALIDLCLEDMRGDAVLSELRERGVVRAAALVSGATMPPTANAAAADAWIRKPFELDDLMAAVKRLLAQPASKVDTASH